MSNMEGMETSVDAALALAGELGFEVAITSTWENGKIFWDAYVNLPESFNDPVAEAEDVDPARAILTALKRAVAAQKRPALAA